MGLGNILTGLTAALVLVVLYLYKINTLWKHVSPEHLPEPWTPEKIREGYERVKKNRVDFTKLLPPHLERRYVIVGGAGLVGGDIVLQLLQRGQSPQSIRIIDFQPRLTREKMLSHPGATECDYVQADITSTQSISSAFSKPWPSSVANLPLTVYHTAALIRPAERKFIFYDRLSRVNLVGAANVLDCARKAGADIFVATSSASVGIKPIQIWGWPWGKKKDYHVQVYDESDFDKPLRPHSEFFSNYGYSKAEAERLICSANSPEFKTGVIRPGNGIYGDPADVLMALTVKIAKESGGNVTSFTPQIVQNCVASRNVALAHLLFEAALAKQKEMPRCAGRPYNITDPGPLVQFRSMYALCQTLSEIPTGIRLNYPPPVMMKLLAEIIEKWCVFLYYTPDGIKNLLGLKEPGGLVANLQPAIFTVCSHTICDDSLARKSIKEGGLGYRGGCDTFEGMLDLMVDLNEIEEKERGREAQKEGKGVEKKTAGEKIKGFVPVEPVAA